MLPKDGISLQLRRNGLDAWNQFEKDTLDYWNLLRRRNRVHRCVPKSPVTSNL